MSLNVAIEAQEEAVRDQNYTLAAECKAKVSLVLKFNIHKFYSSNTLILNAIKWRLFIEAWQSYCVMADVKSKNDINKHKNDNSSAVIVLSPVPLLLISQK